MGLSHANPNSLIITPQLATSSLAPNNPCNYLPMERNEMKLIITSQMK